MTEKQKKQFNTMLNALKNIYKWYDTSEKVIKNAEKNYGLSWQEALEMAYDNIQQEARLAAYWVKHIK